MSGLEVAAGVIAVVQISGQVASLCYQYSKDVKDARQDIEQLAREVNGLQIITKNASKLLKSPQGKRLESSEDLHNAAQHAKSKLEALETDLSPKKGQKTLSRIRIRALKWPLGKKNTEKTVQELARCTQAISSALQVAQTLV